MKLKSFVLFTAILLMAVPGICSASAINKGQNAASTGFSGTVEEAMNAKGYTYVLVDDGVEKRWAAAPEFEVKVGDRVIVPPSSEMHDFYSKTLNRKFEIVMFAAWITKEGETPSDSGLPEGHMPIAVEKSEISKPLEMDFSGIQKPKGGKTVAEIYASKETLVDKEVLVRGKVVKFVQNVMGRNWLHLQDGTGEKGKDDLTITANVEETAGVGDTVLVRGRVLLNKDFGSGYRYDLLIVDGKIKVEP